VHWTGGGDGSAQIGHCAQPEGEGSCVWLHVGVWTLSHRLNNIPLSLGLCPACCTQGISRHFFHFLPKQLVLLLLVKESGVNGPWGWSNLAVFTFLRDTIPKSEHRCQREGCVALPTSLKCTQSWQGFLHAEGQTGVGNTRGQQKSRWCVVWTPWKPIILGKSIQLHPLCHCHLQILRL